MRYTISGMDKLIADLKSRGQSMTGPAATNAVRAGGQVIEREMVLRAPEIVEKVGPNSSSLNPGELKDSIQTRVSKKSGQSTALIGPTGYPAVVGFWVEYGHLQAAGGPVRVLANGRTSGKGRHVGFVMGHPWARPAYESSVQEATQVMADSLAKAWQKKG